MLNKTFDPAEAEPRLYDAWESSDAFKPSHREGAKPFCVVIPPPNVTGSLHMGHALNGTLQDVLVRFERMRGKNVLWQCGTDHAGIATQMVVEREMAKTTDQSRRDMGREAFLERVWAWKEQSGGTISRQLRRLGASCDWSRERFTMDEGLSAAVRKVFVQLYKDGLLYRDERLVNWDPKFQTAISDLEVENREVDGHLWHIRYPIEGEEGRFITVATTRPETMLGDTAIAVHPEDERYKALVGKFAILPIVRRRLPIVADEYADPEQGSGAVKITPAHDFNDFEVGRRHDLERISVLTPEAKISDNAPSAFRGLDRYEARERIIETLREEGLLEQIEDKIIQQPYGDRSGVVIEPYLTLQWYVNAEEMAKPAIAAVERGETVFVPRNWEKTYFEWMRNIQPWCVSRQLWWGHQIPAWYGPDGEVFVEETEAEAKRAAAEHYGGGVELRRDEDVLDTWFSSALWPFSTLGWPEETPELKTFYKTDVLITGFDIIFFWVARMMMMGLKFMGEAPFHTVYITALVRDEHGQKMSKSKGNVVDPLELIDEYGADALRFTIAAMAGQGRDVKFAKSRVEGYRNFGTKIWNAARFGQMNECLPREGFDPSTVTHTVNKWICHEAQSCLEATTQGIEAHRYNEAASAIYHFAWHVYCDWYLELIKPVLDGEDEALKAETRATAGWAFDQILILLHPLMPFLTEELWAAPKEYGVNRAQNLITTPWPDYAGRGDREASEEMDWVIKLISAIRSVRTEMNVPVAAKIPLLATGASADTLARFERNKEALMRLARIEAFREAAELPKGAVQIVHGEATFALPVADFIDIEAELSRLAKEVSKADGEIKRFEGKLNNEKFVSRAPVEVVEGEREKLKLVKETRQNLLAAKARLESVL